MTTECLSCVFGNVTAPAFYLSVLIVLFGAGVGTLYGILKSKKILSKP